MAEDKLGEILKNSSPEKESGKKEEKQKPVSTLESAINETFDAAGKLGRGAAAVSLPVLADMSMGGFGASSTAAAFYAAEKKHPFKLSTLATAFAVFANYTLPAVSSLALLPRVIATAAWNLAANAYYMTTRKAIYGESFKGYWNEFKGLTKKVMAFLYLPTLLTTYLNPLLQVPAIALQSFIFKKYIDPIKEEKPKKEKDQTPYAVALGNVARKAGKGISDAIYGMSKSIADKLYSQPAKPAPKSTEPAAHPA